MTIGSFLLRLVFILAAGATVIYLTNSHTANTYFAQFGAPTGNNVNGTWIGILDNYDHPPPEDSTGFAKQFKRDPFIQQRAAILISVHLTDAYLEVYKGDGSFFTQGATHQRNFDSVDFDMTEGKLHGSVYTYETPAAGVHASVHKINGVLSGGTLTITDMDFGDYSFRGPLQHGDKKQYLELCQSLGYNPADGKEVANGRR